MSSVHRALLTLALAGCGHAVPLIALPPAPRASTCWRRSRDRRGPTRRRARWSRSCSRAALQPHLLRDDHLHDLVGAGEDALNPRVHERARHRVLEHVAVAAEELQALV